VMMAQGKEWKENWQGREAAFDLFWMRGLSEMILHRLGLLQDVTMKGMDHVLLNKGVQYVVDGETILSIGRVQNAMRKKLGVKVHPVFAEWNWTATVKAIRLRKVQYKEVGKFPEMRRDFALLVDENISFDSIRLTALNQIKGDLLRDVRLFDVYVGDRLPKGKKSYAVAFQFRDDAKTMTDKQVDKLMERIRLALEKELGAELR